MVLNDLAGRLMQMVLADDVVRGRGADGAADALREMLARARAANDELRAENAALEARAADLAAQNVALEADLSDLRGTALGSAEAQAIALALAQSRCPAGAHDARAPDFPSTRGAPPADEPPPAHGLRARADALEAELAARTAALADAYALLDVLEVPHPTPVERAAAPEGPGAAPAAGAAAGAAGARRERERCVFDLEDIEAGQTVMRLPCMHVFHRDCLLPYLRRPGQPMCPIDRESINRADIPSFPVWVWGG